MKLIICNNYEELSQKAAEIVSRQIKDKPDTVLGLATGSSPIGLYHNLAEMNLDFSQVKTYNLDEYYPISRDHNQSYYYFMNQHLYSKVNLKPENIHIPNGSAPDPHAECQEYDNSILAAGGIDLQVLGIGQNGHIGFNEPADHLIAATHLTDLTQNTLEANSRFFDRIEDVPTQALTMGMGTILRAKKIVMVVNGANKHKVLAELLEGDDMTTNNPATLLKMHPDVTIICDKEAYNSGAKLGIDIGGTYIKFAVIDGDRMIYKSKIPSNQESAKTLLDEICDECQRIAKEHPYTAIGVGTPGLLYNGLLTTVNLPFNKTPIAKEIQKQTGLPVVVDNDANCAVLGEFLYGSAKKYNNVVLVTLGTGIGGGVIIERKLLRGTSGACELGHITIQAENGLVCTCGEAGCFEQYASVSALVRQATEACAQNPESLLTKLFKENGKLNGKLIFQALNENCPVAKSVFDRYLNWLCVGLRSLKKIFDPDIILLGGGIANEGDALLKPLQEKLGMDVNVKVATLQNDAGVFGAANL